MNRRLDDLPGDVLLALRTYDWEGNVRELENVMERAVVLCKGNSVTLRDLPEEVRGRDESVEAAPVQGQTLTQILEALERQILVRTLEKNRGSQTKTAGELGIKRTTLRYKMGKYGLV